MEVFAIYKICPILPEKVKEAILKLDSETAYKIAEIRLRSANICTVTIDGNNYYLSIKGLSADTSGCIQSSGKELEEVIYRFCGGSVYAYEESLKSGYISADGIRMGISGEAIIKNGKTFGFSSINSICIRLPHHIDGASDVLISHIIKNGFKESAGILVASAPGVGKTTVLRDVAIRLSKGIGSSINTKKVYRVAIVDERCEIYIPSLFSGCAVDVYTKIPKSEGLEFASRVLSPEVVICDEISASEAEAIGKSHIGGSAVIASVHAESAESALKKPAVNLLCERGVFSHILFLKRNSKIIHSELYDIKEMMLS